MGTEPEAFEQLLEAELELARACVVHGDPGEVRAYNNGRVAAFKMMLELHRQWRSAGLVS
jgi:hypothetical protein